MSLPTGSSCGFDPGSFRCECYIRGHRQDTQTRKATSILSSLGESGAVFILLTTAEGDDDDGEEGREPLPIRKPTRALHSAKSTQPTFQIQTHTWDELMSRKNMFTHPDNMSQLDGRDARTSQSGAEVAVDLSARRSGPAFHYGQCASVSRPVVLIYLWIGQCLRVLASSPESCLSALRSRRFVLLNVFRLRRKPGRPAAETSGPTINSSVKSLLD
ncbi:hypothetical protein F2P81_011375 [Scophthalmus maximus]|uniref:Uncharacterized protein n=1 Tax=Scophthalmus maximus TaxID=52904 RepID=A0A6A4SPY9_SCOMX|nr:hypothetical protein F2P81_011375 [Scophthalmus maximus]